MADSTVGGTLRTVVETIHSPTYPAASGCTPTRIGLPINVRGWTFDEVELVAKPIPCFAVVADPDSLTRDAMTLIDRLTAGDRREE